MLDVGLAVIRIVVAATREIVWREHRIVRCAQWRVQIRIDEANLEVLPQKRLLIHPAELQIVDALGIRDIAMHARIRKRALLRHALLLDRPKVIQRIVARIVVVRIAPHVWPKVEGHRRANRARITRRNIDRLDLRTLVR